MRFALPLLLAVAVASPAAPPDPLAFIPKEATLVLKVEKPRALVEAVTKLDVFKEYETLPQVKELLASTTAKRFFQFVTLAEKKLGAEWPKLLDDLAGGGIALGTVPGGDNAPAVLVIQGTDERKSAAAFKLLTEILTDELARLSPPGVTMKPETGTVKGVDCLKIDGLYAGQLKGTLVVATQKAAMEKTLSLLAAEKDAKSVLTNPDLPAARKVVGGDPLAWFWFDLKKAKEDKALKDFLDTARTQPFILFLFGSTADAVRRADFIAGGLFATKDGFRACLKLPAKRAELHPVMALHAPLKREVVGTLPLLEPPGVLYSQSLYLDVGHFWKNRKDAIGEQELKDLEAFEKQISAILPDTTLGKLLEMSGPHHRLVAVERGENQYKTPADFPLPEVALVTSMKDKEFGKKMTASLKVAAALATPRFGLTKSEETVDGVDILSYRFSEKPDADDPTHFRLNFAPSFAVVGESFVVASSPKLLKDLIPELKKPVDAKKCSDAVWRARGYGAGAAVAVKARPESSITDSVLGRGVGLVEAKKQLDQLAAVLNKLGTLDVTIDHADEAFTVEAEWRIKK